MEKDKIYDRMQQLELHLEKNKKVIPKAKATIIMNYINLARDENISDEELNDYYGMVRDANKKMLGDNALSWTGTPSLPIAINAGVQEQANKVRPFLIDSFRMVDPKYLRGRGGRILDAEGFADMIIDSANRRLETEYNNQEWNGEFPITLKEVPTLSDDGGEV